MKTIQTLLLLAVYIATTGCPDVVIPPTVTPSTDAGASDTKPFLPDLAPPSDLAVLADTAPSGADTQKPDMAGPLDAMTPDSQSLAETNVPTSHPPTLATVASSTALYNGENTGYKFSHTAPSSNDVALYEFTMAVQSFDATLSGYRVFENGVALASTAYTVTGDTAGNLTQGSGNSFGPNAVQNVKVRFVLGGRTTSAGMTKVYEARMTALGVMAGSTVIHRLLGENGQPEITGTIAQVQSAGANFIWSDTSDPAHSSTSPDWRNGSGVPNLGSLPAATLSQ